MGINIFFKLVYLETFLSDLKHISDNRKLFVLQQMMLLLTTNPFTSPEITCFSFVVFFIKKKKKTLVLHEQINFSIFSLCIVGLILKLTTVSLLLLFILKAKVVLRPQKEHLKRVRSVSIKIFLLSSLINRNPDSLFG